MPMLKEAYNNHIANTEPIQSNREKAVRASLVDLTIDPYLHYALAQEKPEVQLPTSRGDVRGIQLTLPIDISEYILVFNIYANRLDFLRPSQNGMYEPVAHWDGNGRNRGETSRSFVGILGDSLEEGIPIDTQMNRLFGLESIEVAA